MRRLPASAVALLFYLALAGSLDAGELPIGAVAVALAALGRRGLPLASPLPRLPWRALGTAIMRESLMIARSAGSAPAEQGRFVRERPPLPAGWRELAASLAPGGYVVHERRDLLIHRMGHRP